MKEMKDLHVDYLDFANAFRSVPHSILWMALNFFQVSESNTKLVKVYFHDMQICITAHAGTTVWQHFEMGIMADCTISALAFIMAMKLIDRRSW